MSSDPLTGRDVGDADQPEPEAAPAHEPRHWEPRHNAEGGARPAAPFGTWPEPSSEPFSGPVQQEADEALSPQELSNEIIGRLYDVAVDPLRLGDLLDDWERLNVPLRQAMEAASPESDPSRLRRRRRIRAVPPPLPGVDLTEHFRRVAMLLDQTRAAGHVRPEEAELARFARSAAFAVGPDLRIAAANRAARLALHAEPGHQMSSLPFDAPDLKELANRLRQMLREGANGEDGMPSFLRLRRLGSGRIVLMQLSTLRPEGAAPFAIIVTSELRWPDTLDRTLRDAFGLTPAEIEILRTLSEANSLKEIADARGRSVETVRVQIKAIQAKTETSSQHELVRLTLSIMEVAPDQADASDARLADHGRARPAPARSSRGTLALAERPFHVLMRPDGRRVDYLLLGDPDGQPVLSTHGGLGLCRWPATLEQQAAEAGLCVVVPVRPGYGGSSPLPAHVNRSTIVADDMAALMDLLGVASVPIVTMDEDVHYAALLHSRHPGRVSGVIAIAGTLPFTRREQYERMGRWHRFIMAGARYTPALFPFMVRTGFAMARRMGKPEFIRTVYAQADADSRLAERAEVFEALAVGSEITLTEGFDAAAAYAAEVITYEANDWRDDLEAMRETVPVHFLHGDQDLQMVPETRAELALDYPWITFTLIPEAGQLLLFQHGDMVLDLLRKQMMKRR